MHKQWINGMTLTVPDVAELVDGFRSGDPLKQRSAVLSALSATCCGAQGDIITQTAIALEADGPAWAQALVEEWGKAGQAGDPPG